MDVAVVNGALSGFELKSARDTLRRLPKQIEIYSRVLDHAVLVVADNHLDSAMSLVPDWWGVVSAQGSAGAVVL
ncbi:sce7726 family protein [Rhodococcus sp. EPR-157]|uniref:sce7726 family protein n=1 Tax=Rhodococcus sp. EPR-157 TaxID=1813677 RepID=UPI000A5822C4